MDETKRLGSRSMTAVVQRQFEPARIERDLLAQTFDLLCVGELSRPEVGHQYAERDPATIAVPAGDLPSKTIDSGRRVA